MVQTKDKDTTEKKTPVKRASRAAVEKKPRATRKKAETEETVETTAKEKKQTATAPVGRYIFATGRRKSAVATVRVFSGSGDAMVNKKAFSTYFFHQLLQDAVMRPLQVTGLGKDYYFVATIRGGGINAQAEALAHAIAKTLTTLGDETRKVLKKNGLLTRDDRKKERKKPGLKRARRAPQWAKR